MKVEGTKESIFVALLWRGAFGEMREKEGKGPTVVVFVVVAVGSGCGEVW